MGENDLNTRQRIIEESKREFMEKGFQEASLRNIVKRAGVTTGAFYGYFPNKQALFDALITPAAEGLKTMFLSSHMEFEKLPEDMQRDVVFEFSIPFQKEMISYIYEHFDAFKLLVDCAGGTVFQDYLNSLVEVEVESTLNFIRVTNNDAIVSGRVAPELIHIISSAYFSAIFEVVAHDMAREAADMYVESLRRFFTAGWKTILNPERSGL
jgi:TetR/AcrR family transcriptional regulator